jgi:GTP cyclohydrolase I
MLRLLWSLKHMSKYILTNKMVSLLALATSNSIAALLPKATKAYAIPRGGIPAALAIAGHHGKLQLVDDPAEADLFIDDIIDSGDTMHRWCDEYPGTPFFALIDKTEDGEFSDRWVVFPWEQTAEGGIEDNIKRLLQFVGENPERGGLLETPHRVAKAWGHWCSGYDKKAEDILKVFDDGAEKCDEMVIVKDIPVYSKCEHHLADIFGTVTIAYIPNGKIVGLSKLSRLADMFARRLQVQERLTNQIADALEEHLQPKGVGVIVRARHLCMESRGICQQGHHTITSALRGVLKDKPEARAEFMELAK